MTQLANITAVAEIDRDILMRKDVLALCLKGVGDPHKHGWCIEFDDRWEMLKGIVELRRALKAVQDSLVLDVLK